MAGTPRTVAGAAALEALFPLASRYAPPAERASVREPAVRFRTFPYSERHLHCVWGDPALRPGGLLTSRGEPVEVEDPGAWNLEAGPDFLGAALRIGTERRRVTGDIEIHIHPSDWRQHRHREDANYRRVVAHVTYFSAPLSEADLPPGCVQLALKEPLAANPLFAFENIDITAYPYAARADVPPCSAEIAQWSIDHKQALLDAAGEERLRRKAERLALSIGERSEEQAVYEEVCAALGYQHNKTPFRRLAEIVTFEDLRREAAGDPLVAYALLAGVAGLLPEAPRESWDDETRAWLRSVWDAWWRRKAAWEARILPRSLWRLSPLRPVNHPLRRMMAAARLFTSPDPLGWIDGATLDDIGARLQAVSDPYWSHRESLGGKRSAAPIQLIGAERADAMLVNVFAPFLAATGRRSVANADWLLALPPEGDNALLRRTAHHLFGPDHPAKLAATGRRKQGLLQIFHDYCLNDRSRCAACPFPGRLRAWRTGGAAS